MMNSDMLGAQIEGHLSNIRRVAPDVIRGERISGEGTPFAVYFFALSDDLTAWANNLEEWQDKIIGPSYYESQGDLRWNHYLYLLANKDARTSQPFDELKRAIESDRSYTRKFVVVEEELPNVLERLRPSEVSPRGETRPDVVGRWTTRLLKAGLGVVLENHSLTETVKQICGGGGEPLETSSQSSPRVDQPLATQFLDAVEIVSFRKWPAIRKFESLGTVNLLYGVNGSGKTTLLEAIEFLYCQENVRTRPPSNTHIKARLKGEAAEQETRVSVNTSEAKQRHLDWYGQRDLRGCKLSNSFARFNFLSTDEAAMLGRKDSEATFEERLSRLVAGPQAAKLWDHISRLQPRLEKERSILRTLYSEAKQKKAHLRELLDTLAAAPKASDSDLSALAEDLVRLRWKSSISRENVATHFVPNLARASSIVREITRAKLRLESVSRDSVFAAHSAAITTMENVERLLEKMSEFEIKKSNIVAARKELLNSFQIVEQIVAAQQVDAFSLVEESDRIQNDAIRLQKLVGSEKLESAVPGWIEELGGTLDGALTSLQQELASLATKVSYLEKSLVELRKKQSLASSMLAEIQALAKQFILHDSNHKNCPVCTTVFNPGELHSRLVQAESEVSEDLTSPVLELLLNAREQNSRLEAMQSVLVSLAAYAKRSGKEYSKLGPLEVFRKYHFHRRDLDRLQVTHTDLTKELIQLGPLGHTYESVKEARRLAGQMDIDVSRKDAAKDTLDRMTAEFKKYDTEIDVFTRGCAALRTETFLALPGQIESVDDLESTVAAFRSRLTLLQEAVELVEKLQQFLVLDGNTNLGSFAPLLDSARVTAERFAKALEKEEPSRKSENDATKSLSEIDEQIELHKAAGIRVTRAIKVLQALDGEDSLSAATDSELTNAHDETSAIFSRIHSPLEYGVRRDAREPLFRLDSSDEFVTLRNVSTGQRAAFVLSVFMAMNAKLQTAPPVLLFDDPVAHIDDFNALSFLDHLRDVALNGNRQIFYATADDRIAGLIEHKFSFMGDKFKRIDLER